MQIDNMRCQYTDKCRLEIWILASPSAQAESAKTDSNYINNTEPHFSSILERERKKKLEISLDKFPFLVTTLFFSICIWICYMPLFKFIKSNVSFETHVHARKKGTAK